MASSVQDSKKRKAGNGVGGESDEELTKRIAEVYWRVTEDVRTGAHKMEDIIATGKDDKVLEFSKENMPTLWGWLMESVGFYNNILANFFKECPLVSTICSEDKTVLSAHSYLSVWMIWNAPLFKNGDTYIPFLNGYRYNRVWMESILPKDFVDYLYNYAEKQNAARFSINELSLLACMALTPKGVSGLKDPDAVNKIHDTLHKAMEVEVHKSRVNPKEMLKEVPIMLQTLETAVAKQEIIMKLQAQQTHPEMNS